MSYSVCRIIGACLLSIALAGTTGLAVAQKKADPESVSGHGQGADQRLLKNPYPAGCASAVQTTVNPQTGETTDSCRGSDGNIKILPRKSK